MNKIENLLKTPEGAKALKEKLKAMPESEKVKANYQTIWQMVCAKVNEYNLHKNQSQLKKGVSTGTKKSIKDNSLKKIKEAVKKRTVHLHRPPKDWDKVSETIQMLQNQYLHLFKVDDPKLLKIGILEDLISDGWDERKIRHAMKYYVFLEQYQTTFFKHSHRYDLLGSQISVITGEEKLHAIIGLHKVIGRFKMQEADPKLMHQINTEPLQPILSASYGNHYYYQDLIPEVLKILLDCYGHHIAVTDEQEITTGHAVSSVTIKLQGKVLFQFNSQAEHIKEARKKSNV